jgi:hypothetical protein
MGQKRLEEVRAAQPPNITQCLTYTTTTSSVACGQKWVCKPGPYGSQVCGYEPTNYPVCNITVTRDTRPSTKVVPAYMVVSLDYALPGNDSKIEYTNEAGRGATWEISFGTSGRLNIGLDPTGSLMSEYKFTQKSSTKVSSQSASSATATVASSQDAPDYTLDTFHLWLNPVITTYTGCGQPDVSVYSSSGEGRTYFPPGNDPNRTINADFTVRHLLNPETIPAESAWKRTFVQQFTRQEMLDLVTTLDPPILPDGTMNMAPALDRDRYRDPSDLGVLCPAAWDGVWLETPIVCTVEYSYAMENTNTFDVNWEVNLKTKLLGSSASLQTYFSRTHTETNTTGNGANLRIATSTPNVCFVGQIFIDTMFNTYVVNGTMDPCF